jgi:hypothetical protein
MPETRNRLTRESIAAMRAAHARIAPFLPPDIAQAIWIARLSGHYDPAAGKTAIPALGLYPPDEQPGFSGGRMPGSLAPESRFGAGDLFPQTTVPPNPMAPRDPMPDMSGPLQSPFVRAAMASLAASYARRGEPSPFAPQSGFGNNDTSQEESVPSANAEDARSPMPDMSGPLESPFFRAAMALSSVQQQPANKLIDTVYADDSRSNDPYGLLTPIARVPTPGRHTRDHDPDSVLGSGDPRYEIHPPWSGYNREELPGGGLVPAFGTWTMKQEGWLYSSDGGRT